MSQPPDSQKLRVLIADDHPLFRMGLRYALSAKNFAVIAEAENGKDAIGKALSEAPDIVLLDVKMPVTDGIEACRILRQRAPKVLIIMLTTFEEEAIIQAARDAGAHGFFSKETDPAELAAKLERIVANPQGDWLPSVQLPELTARESQVLQLLGQGYSNKKIAKQLAISPETVKDYLHGIYRKLDVSDRLAAVSRARQLGLLNSLQ